MGSELGTPCIVNLWIPDGYKDVPGGPAHARALSSRNPWTGSSQTRMDPATCKDAVEGKLFGIGSECYVVGSHEFYLAYAVKNDLMLTPRHGALPSHGVRGGQDLRRSSSSPASCSCT